MSAFFDSSSKINAIHPAFTKKLSFVIQFTNIDDPKIDDTIFETYEIVITAFSVSHQVKKLRFFKKTILVVNINPNVVFKKFFLILSSANDDFSKRKL